MVEADDREKQIEQNAYDDRTKKTGDHTDRCSDQNKRQTVCKVIGRQECRCSDTQQQEAKKTAKPVIFLKRQTAHPQRSAQSSLFLGSLAHLFRNKQDRQKLVFVKLRYSVTT